MELKLEDGRVIWEVEFADDAEVEIDATTGVIVKVETADDRGGNSGPGSGDDDHDDDRSGNSGRGGDDDESGDDHGSNSGRDGSDD